MYESSQNLSPDVKNILKEVLNGGLQGAAKTILEKIDSINKTIGSKPSSPQELPSKNTPLPLNTPKKETPYLVYAGVGVLVIVVFILLVIFLKRKNNKKNKPLPV